MDKNPKHDSDLFRKFLKDNRVDDLEQPSQCTHLSLIENVWTERKKGTATPVL